MLSFSFFLRVFSLLLFSISTVAGNPYCNICGDGKVITDWDSEVVIPTFGVFTCQLLDTRSHEGYVPAENCLALQMFSRRNCGCEDAPPTPSPTQSPGAANNCLHWCPSHTKSWDEKCGWTSCRGCSECSATPAPSESSEPTMTPSSSPTAIHSTAPTMTPSEAHSTAPTTMPSEKPTLPLFQDSISGLSMTLRGITDLSVSSQTELTTLLEAFTFNFFDLFNPAIEDLVTTITITEVISGGRRANLRRALGNPSDEVTIVYTQTFEYRTDSQEVTTEYLATEMFDHVIGRHSFVIALEDSQSQELQEVKFVSQVTLPSP